MLAREKIEREKRERAEGEERGGKRRPTRAERGEKTCAIMDSGLNWYRKSIAVLQDARTEEQEKARGPENRTDILPKFSPQNSVHRRP